MTTLIMKHFYRMPPPPQSEIDKREQAVRQVIASMGNKYCLARPMPRKG